MFITASIIGHPEGLVILYRSLLGLARFQKSPFVNLLIQCFNNYFTVPKISRKREENIAIRVQKALCTLMGNCWNIQIYIHIHILIYRATHIQYIHSHTDTEVKKNKGAKLEDNSKGTEQTQNANHFWVFTYGYA